MCVDDAGCVLVGRVAVVAMLKWSLPEGNQESDKHRDVGYSAHARSFLEYRDPGMIRKRNQTRAATGSGHNAIL